MTPLARPGEQVLVLHVGDDALALPLTDVWEVIARPRITPVPTVGPPVVGLFILRGELVPAFDPAWLLGVTGAVADPPRPPYVAVVDTGGARAGLIAGALPSVAILGPELDGADGKPTGTVHRAGSGTVTLVDPSQLLGGAELAAPAAALSPNWARRT